MDFNYDTETITPEHTGMITIGGAQGVEMPAGTTAERPVSPADGTMRFNTDLNYVERYSQGEWVEVIDANTGRWDTAQVVKVQKNPNPGEFSSIAAAIASITDASASKPYVIQVAPGVYNEPQLVMKEHITVFGSGTSSTILHSTDLTSNFIVGARYSAINFVSIDATGQSAGNSLIYLDEDSNDIQNSFLVYHCSLRGGYQLAQCARGSLQIANCIFGGAYSFTRGFESVNSTTGARLVLRNVFSTRLSQPYPEFLIKVDGTNAFSVVTALFNRARGAGVPNTVPAGTGIWIRNGGQMRMQSTSILGYDKGIWLENAGAAPSANFNAVFLDFNEQDLVVEHPGAIGSFNGTLDHTLSSSVPGYPIQALDDEAPGSVSVGSLFIGQDLDTLTDVTDLLQKGGALGVVQGGDVTQGTNALDVDVSAGFGYRADAVTANALRFEWPLTTVTVADNQVNFIYLNSAGVVTSSLAIPNYLTNIILAVVTTDSGSIRRITNVAYDLNHQPTKIDNFLRTVIGPLVVDGLLVTQGSTAVKLNVSAGQVAYSSKRFDIAGASDAQFVQIYRSSGNWVYGSVTSSIPVTQYDNGTNLTTLTTDYFTKHVLYVAQDDAVSRFLLQYGTAEYATQGEAEAAPLPARPPKFIDVVPVAALVVQKDATSVATYIDVRPRIGTTVQVASGGTSGDHGSLVGLGDDDHPQYLPLTGVRAMTGDIDMGGNSITNVNLVDGVDVAAHGSRHNPNGADPISTAVAASLSPASTNTAGTANSLARSDHTHQITGFQPVDADLTAIAALTTTGLATRTATDTWVTRSIAGTTGNIVITNGDGVSGNPTVNLAAAGTAGTHGTATSVPVFTTDTFGRVTSVTNTTIAFPVSSVFGRTGAVVATEGDYSLNQLGDVTLTTPTNGQVLRYNGTQWVNDIDYVGTVTSVAATQPTAGLTITGSPITTSGTLTFALANDLGAIEALNGTGFYTRTGTDTWAARTITGTTNQITVTEGAGTAGNPTIAIAADPVLSGTGGLVLTSGTTAQRPVSPSEGTIRYNSTSQQIEIFQGGTWLSLSGTTTGRGIINIYTGIIPAASGTTQTPYDNTPPLDTEGSLIWSFTVTPTKLTSEFKLTVPFTSDCSTNNRVVITSIFRNGINIGSAIFFATGGGRPTTTTLSVADEPNTLSPVTYSMRTGISTGSGGSWYINSTSSGNDLGGTLVSTWQITEVA